MNDEGLQFQRLSFVPRPSSIRKERAMYQRILVPLDGSELAQTALPHALDLCRACAATLLLLHVRDPRSGSVEAAQRYLEYINTQNAWAGVAVEVLVREGSVAAAIIDAAGQERVDLIVMATHGRSGLQRVVYGSVAEQVLRGASTPVLLVRVPGALVEQPEGASLPQPGLSAG
jgi:nucleotide-binding universal stress UspA family protein